MKIPTIVDVKQAHQLKQLKLLRVQSVAYVVAQIFPKHIGEKNAILRSGLFKKIFGMDDEGTLADELRWDYVKKGMHFLRQRTKCFISSKYNPDYGEWEYFVIKNMSDAQHYIDTLNRNIKRMRTMQQRAVKAAENGWHRQNWMTFAEQSLLTGYEKEIQKKEK